jgi:hypothetical protein
MSSVAITLSLCISFEMSRYQLGHFKHGHLFFATKDNFQFGISIDHAAICGILKIMLLDVVPHLFGNFSPGNRF